MQSPAPTAARFEVPAAVGQWLERLPAWPGSLLFVTALNLMLSRQLPGDVVQALQGRSLRIHVRDARIGFDFTWRGNGFLPRTRTRTHTPDLTISASAADFVALARREQDPDTLFFSRRLSMEGDTCRCSTRKSCGRHRRRSCWRTSGAGSTRRGAPERV